MSQRRPQGYCAHSFFAAAEVLEVRSLLSAGPSAVHAAMPHSNIQSPAVKSPPTFQGTVSALITIPGHTDAIATGTALVSHFAETFDSKVKASFTLAFSDGGTSATIKGTYRGMIQGMGQLPPETIFQLSATGGKLTLTENVEGKTIKATAAPTNDVLAGLALDDGDFQRMRIVGAFSVKAQGGFSGKVIDFGFGP